MICFFLRPYCVTAAPIDLAREKNDAEMVEMLRKPPMARRNSKAPVLSRVSKQEKSSSSQALSSDGLGSPKGESAPTAISGIQSSDVDQATSSHSPPLSGSSSPPPSALHGMGSPRLQSPSTTDPSGMTAEDFRAVAVPLEARFLPLPASPAPVRQTEPPVQVLNRIPSPESGPLSPPREAVETTAAQPFRDGPTKSVIVARPKAKQKNPNRRSKSLDLTRLLVEAAGKGDLTRMKSLVSQGAKVNGVDPVTGNTPLVAAVLSCNNEAIMFLLDHPDINVNKPTNTGSTVLHVLAETGNEDAAVWLIRRGANVNAKNSRGVTPLQLSAKLSDLVASGAIWE